MKSILIIEDSPIASGLLGSCAPQIERQIADSLGLETVESFEEVEAICTQEVFPFGCVTVDMQIPKRPGHEREPGENAHTAWGLRALRAIEGRLALTKILIITGHFPEIESQLTAAELEQVREKQLHSEQFVCEVVEILNTP